MTAERRQHEHLKAGHFLRIRQWGGHLQKGTSDTIPSVEK